MTAFYCGGVDKPYGGIINESVRDRMAVIAQSLIANKNYNNHRQRIWAHYYDRRQGPFGLANIK